MGTQPNNPVIEGQTVQSPARTSADQHGDGPRAEQPVLAVPVAARRMPPRCLDCGYDLSATSRSGVCPECGRSARRSVAVPLDRFFLYRTRRPLGRALRTGAVAVALLCLAAWLAGAAFAMIQSRSGAMTSVALMIAAALLVGLHALIGLFALFHLAFVRGTSYEPRWSREPRQLLKRMVVTSLLAWPLSGVLGATLVLVEPRIGMLAIPVMGGLLAMPPMLAARWALSIETAIKPDRVVRRAELRRAVRREVALVAWAVVAVPAQWPILMGGSGTGPQWLAVVFFVGGISFGLLILDCARSLWRASGRLRVLAKAGRPAI